MIQEVLKEIIWEDNRRGNSQKTLDEQDFLSSGAFAIEWLAFLLRIREVQD
jgi:hypothetical protein